MSHSMHHLISGSAVYSDIYYNFKSNFKTSRVVYRDQRKLSSCLYNPQASQNEFEFK